MERGEAPLWNPDIYGGAPLLADGQSMVGSPVTWLRLIFEEDLAQDLGVAWLLVWTALGVMLLLRRLDVTPWAACVGGMAAMTSPFLHVWLLHPQAATFCWIAWVLWSIEGRRAVPIALCTLGLMWGGHPGTVFHGLLLSCGWWALRSRSPEAVLGVGLGVLTSLPLTLPLCEQALRSTTATARGDSVLELSQLLDLLWPGWLGHPALETWEGSGAWADGQLHPGPATSLLSLLALGGRHRGVGRSLWVAWFCLVLVSLVGLPGPFNDARLASLGTLLLALGAGLGAERLKSMGAPTLAGLCLVTLFSGGWARDPDQAVLPSHLHQPEPAAWTQTLVQELDCDAANDCGRVLGLGWWLQPNTGSLVGLRDLRGYDLPVSEDTHRLMTALYSPPRGPWYPVDTTPSLHLLRFAGVRILLSEEEPVGSDSMEELSLTHAPLRAWRLSGDIPRAWVTGRAQPIDSADAALRAIMKSDLRSEPPVEGLEAPLEGSSALRSVELEEIGDSMRRMDIETEEEAMLVLSEAWAPGWRAEIDGEEMPVMRVGGAFIGVRVPAGGGELVLRYRPTGWVWGSRLGALGLFGLVSLCMVRRRGSGTAAVPSPVRTSDEPRRPSGVGAGKGA
jgi:hypothetical protein